MCFYPYYKNTAKRMPRMIRRAFTLVEIMIVVAIIALLAAVAIPGLLRTRIAANDAVVRANLRTISTAIENFVSANSGMFPTDEANLTNPSSGPRYLSKPYCNAGTAISGYVYACIWENGYTVTAQPTSCASTGVNSYNITTGGILNVNENCQQAGG